MSNLRIIAAIIFALAIAGCESGEPGLALRDRRALQKNGRPTFGKPIALPVTDQIMFPFAIEMDQEQKSGWGIGSVSGGSLFAIGSSGWGQSGSSTNYYGSDNLSWNNVAFYDPRSSKSRLLFNEPALICAFHARDDKAGPVYGNYLLFAIATADSNHDGNISREDAVRLYRTGADGSGLTPITSPDTQLLDIRNVGDMLYLRVVRDADHDGKFTVKDPIEILRVDPARWADPQLVLPDELRKQAFDAGVGAATRP
jgi:hypothetical protein